MEALKLEVDNSKQQGFVVNNDKKATWCLRKIKQMKEKQSENEKLAKEHIAEIEEEIAEEVFGLLTLDIKSKITGVFEVSRMA